MDRISLPASPNPSLPDSLPASPGQPAEPDPIPAGQAPHLAARAANGQPDHLAASLPAAYRAGSEKAAGCQRSPDGPRILLGRHANPCDGTDCSGCQPCPENHCSTCHREHAPSTCPSCLAVARLNLAMVSEHVGHLPDQAILGRQTWHTHDGLLGGDATVMMTPASTSWPARDTRTVTSEPGDVRPPLDVLASWINRWSRDRHDSRVLPTWDFAWCINHLDSQLHAIGQTDTFAPLARDLARIVYTLETVLHAGDRPDVSRVPCWDCGTRLHLVYAEDADHDYWRCPVCGQAFDHIRYVACRHFQLASRGADRFVAIADAVAVINRPEATVRGWARDGHIQSRKNAAGHVEVWWPDVRERDRTVPTRRRIRR
jgi:hypothetical protein